VASQVILIFQGVSTIADASTGQRADHIVTAVEEIQDGTHEVSLRWA
jgi:hypothetical protein